MAHRIKIKLGDAEFEAEGTEESVQSQYEMFLTAMQSRATAPAAAPAAPQVKSQDQTRSPLFDNGLIARIFEVRPDEVVTLRALPKGESKDADALLLLLYGYKKLKNEEHVLATHLLKASSYSGVPVYRPAHALAQYEEYIMRGGQKKGTTYALNNRGITKAEEIAARVFE